MRFLLVVRVKCPNMEYMVRVVDHHEPLKVFAGNSFPTCVVLVRILKEEEQKKNRT